MKRCVSTSAIGMSLAKNMDGHAEIIINTEVLPVSTAIVHISHQVDVLDISVVGATAEEMVVSLYKEFSI